MMDNEKYNITAHSFRDIFSWKDSDFSVQGIVIPIIQRDYAQGRTSADVSRIRGRFLDVLYKALVLDIKQALDFVYGNIEDNILTPLDGQQRLTTLFLLHYYIAKHEHIAKDDYDFLRRFSYETRTSSRDFCKNLIDFEPDFDKENISEQIKDEAWFLMEWESDPTVCSMLVMLDSIHEKFCQTEGLWEKLIGDAITFYFLPINKMGLTDELYIKMNSRGKPLTMFEHWKAELELSLKKVNKDLAKVIAQKIDKEWTDLLWPYRNSETGNDSEDCVTDDEFLRYVHFVSDVICFKKDESEVEDDFSIIDKLFSKDCVDAEANIKKMEELFDLWLSEPVKGRISAFFNDYISESKHTEGKIISNTVDLFKDCCRNSGLHNNGRRVFALNRFLLLYAFVLYLQHYSEIDDKVFRRRLRILNNLINNSPDSLRANFITGLMSQTEEIIVEGKIQQKAGQDHFNNNQAKEESEKLEWTEDNPDREELLYELEDHPLLNGAISVIGIENIEELHERFLELFHYNDNGEACFEFDGISRALLSIGDFGQNDNGWRYQLGSPELPRIWREMFGPIRDLSRTKDILCQLLRSSASLNKEGLNEFVNENLQKAEEYPWTYYLAKYSQMRTRSRHGKYLWRNSNKYSMIMMTTAVSTSGQNYDIFLYTLFMLAGGTDAGLVYDGWSWSKYQNEGTDKLYMPNQELYLTVEKDCYRIFSSKDNANAEIDRIDIPQNEEGIDTKDRINFGLAAINLCLNGAGMEETLFYLPGEGGHTAIIKHGETYSYIVDESTLADFLDEEDLKDIELYKETECKTLEEAVALIGKRKIKLILSGRLMCSTMTDEVAEAMKKFSE